MILECWFYMFRGIYRHLINAQEQIYSRFVQNVKLVKPTFSTRRGDTRTTAWACATCLLFENLLPVASYSRRVSDLKVPIKYDRTCQGSIKIISIEKTFALHESAWKKHFFPGIFCFKESSWWGLFNHLKMEISKKCWLFTLDDTLRSKFSFSGLFSSILLIVISS